MKIYFTKRSLQEWQEAEGKITASLDLGLTEKQVSKKRIREIAKKIGEKLKDERIKDNYVYLLKNDELYKLALFHQGHFYKLRMFKDFKEPVLEIDGLRMQLVKEFNSAEEYANGIIKELGIRKGTCLECCTGLGYITSQLSVICEKVVTIENSKAVLALARLNPYSKRMFSKNVKRIHGDAFEKVPKIKETFDYIIHDPPRYSHASQLYVPEFYKMLRKRLNPGGKLFHYTGTLTSQGDLNGRIRNDLGNAGFKNVKRIEKLQGFIASL
ncbi:MAG: methyltransferase [Candidatus Micrarchaeota archaeon]|nr:methyltransferase [Candidatus Micrarchaeota archaeon]